MILDPPGRERRTHEENVALFALGELQGPSAWLLAVRAVFDVRLEQRLRELSSFSHTLSLEVRGRPRRIVHPWVPLVKRAKWTVLVTAGVVTGLFVVYQAARNLHEPFSGEPVRDGSSPSEPHGAPAEPPPGTPKKTPASDVITAAYQPSVSCSSPRSKQPKAEAVAGSEQAEP